MQTSFTDAQRQNPVIAESEAVLRKCVHCGFCTATCPTYVLLGDELDSPRGRIWLIKDMLEQGQEATPELTLHIDRCLSCLSCMTTCPSGVDYRRLIDHARVHVEKTGRRPLRERATRALLASLMPYPARFRAALWLAWLARPFRRLLPPSLAAMLELVPARRRDGGEPSRAHAGAAESAAASPADHVVGDARPAAGAENRVGRRRVIVLTGCVQAVVGKSINRATIGLLERAGYDVTTVGGCCGSIVHHMGRDEQGRDLARALLGELAPELEAATAIVSNASGCGASLKDFGHLFRNEPSLAPVATRVAGLTRDISELLEPAQVAALVERRPDAGSPTAGLRVAYHAACSMQHGQRLQVPPRELLRAAGFEVVEIAEGHLCCGSAGTYNMLQPDLAGRLADRKLGNIAATGAEIVAAGNLGCLMQLDARAARGSPPRQRFVHTVELLDWATGGRRPAQLD